MFWQITSYPRCEYHVFLSHCAGDKSWLVERVYEELTRREVVPGLDREDYYYGRDSQTALRDGLLRSRHVVFFITKAMMEYTRGWCPMELAYSGVIQANLVAPGGTLLNYELPLFFLDPNESTLLRTAWASVRDRGQFAPSLSESELVAWTVAQIVAFLRREQALSSDLSKDVIPGQPIHADLSSRPGLVDRIIEFDPGFIP